MCVRVWVRKSVYLSAIATAHRNVRVARNSSESKIAPTGAFTSSSHRRQQMPTVGYNNNNNSSSRVPRNRYTSQTKIDVAYTNAHMLCTAVRCRLFVSHLVTARLLEEPFATSLRRVTVGLEATSLSLSCDSITAMSLSGRQKRVSFTTTPRQPERTTTKHESPADILRIPSRTWSKNR